MADSEIFMGVIGIIIFLLLASPFFIKRDLTLVSPEEDFQDEKEHVFMQLSELEYDFQMGKLSERDYMNTKNELTSKASKFVNHSNEDLIEIERMVDIEIRNFLKKSGVGKGILYEE